MKYIIGRNAWLLALSCCLLVACSSDQSETRMDNGNGSSKGSLLQVAAAYTTNYQTNNQMRAVTEGYSEYNPASDLAIGLFVLPSGTTQSNDAKLIRYNNGVWHSQIMVETLTYTICGYMPKSITSSVLISAGNILLTLSDIPAVIADDVCFVTGIKDGTKDGAGDLLQGNFTYVGNDDNNYICLMMDHLFASVKFNFSVDAEYSTLRTIKLKSMQLQTTKESVAATITLTPNIIGTDPVTEITYSSSGSSSSATFFENAAGIDIKDNAATIRDYSCCFVPGLSNSLTLVCTYDVYDKNGNLIRKDCTATNQLPNLAANRGQFVTINLTVAPTYLYQLSEPDLDNPTILIGD